MCGWMVREGATKYYREREGGEAIVIAIIQTSVWPDTVHSTRLRKSSTTQTDIEG